MLTLNRLSIRTYVLVGSAIMLINLAAILVPTVSALPQGRSISTIGSIIYSPSVSISVNAGKSVGVNNFSLGFFIDFPPEWKTFRDRPALQQLARDANFKMVFIDDRHLGPSDYSKGVGPCTYWNETTETGIFDWTNVDSVVRAIFSIGAEPSIVLSRWDSNSLKPCVPPGMAVNPATLLPYPNSYGAFTTAWVQHFNDIGLPVRYYQIFNEIETYIGWNSNTANMTRVHNFVDLFNAAYVSMHRTNADVSVSFDASTLTWVFPYLLTNAVGIDSFNFHKYDDVYPLPNESSDTVMFQKAENTYFQGYDYETYNVDYVRNTWQSQRGVWLPVIQSEGNWNSTNSPTDERVQQMSGAVRTALVLMMGIIKGLSCNCYYTFTSDAVREKAAFGSGRGYGMIDSDTYHTASPSYNNPWYPYYVQQMIGSNLGLGDPLFETTSSSNDIRALAWQNGPALNLLLISKANDTQIIRLTGISGPLHYVKIDNTIPYTSPRTQEGTVNAEDPLTFNGYTVILLQSSK